MRSKPLVLVIEVQLYDGQGARLCIAIFRSSSRDIAELEIALGRWRYGVEKEQRL